MISTFSFCGSHWNQEMGVKVLCGGWGTMQCCCCHCGKPSPPTHIPDIPPYPSPDGPDCSVFSLASSISIESSASVVNSESLVGSSEISIPEVVGGVISSDRGAHWITARHSLLLLLPLTALSSSMVGLFCLVIARINSSAKSWSSFAY